MKIVKENTRFVIGQWQFIVLCVTHFGILYFVFLFTSNLVLLLFLSFFVGQNTKFSSFITQSGTHELLSDQYKAIEIESWPEVLLKRVIQAHIEVTFARELPLSLLFSPIFSLFFLLQTLGRGQLFYFLFFSLPLRNLFSLSSLFLVIETFLLPFLTFLFLSLCVCRIVLQRLTSEQINVRALIKYHSRDNITSGFHTLKVSHKPCKRPQITLRICVFFHNQQVGILVNSIVDLKMSVSM